jgi:hypothetical protein
MVVALEGKNPELKKVMLNVRKQVLRYEKAKKAGTLKKKPIESQICCFDESPTILFFCRSKCRSK